MGAFFYCVPRNGKKLPHFCNLGVREMNEHKKMQNYVEKCCSFKERCRCYLKKKHKQQRSKDTATATATATVITVTGTGWRARARARAKLKNCAKDLISGAFSRSHGIPDASPLGQCQTHFLAGEPKKNFRASFASRRDLGPRSDDFCHKRPKLR